MKKLMMNAILLIAIFFAKPIFAQGPPPDGGDKGEKIEALRIAFITQELQLSPQEAQKFWPVYNQYRADMKTLRNNFKSGQGGQLTADQQLDFDQKKLDLKKKYKTEFEGAIGKEKVNQLYNIENKFHEKLRELHDQRLQQHGGGPRGGGRP